jgi:preprotein translocase subunit YajC
VLETIVGLLGAPTLFAQGGLLAEGEAVPAAGPDPATAMLVQFMLPMVLLISLYYLMIGRPQQKEQAKRQGMLSALKKNDRVLTIGGAIGVVADISGDGKKVTLKFGEGTRIPFLRSSIQQVLVDEDETKPDAPK